MFWLQYMNHFNRYMQCVTETCQPVCEPEWTTPNTVKLELNNLLLRQFSAGTSGDTILIIPPQAGHHATIADYDRGQSLVEASICEGTNSVYLTEWKSATPDRCDETIDDFILSMHKCIQAIGTKVTLIGLCQGGWQSAIYTALYPEDVENLVLAGAPIDFHAGKSKIGMYASLYPMSFFQSLVAMGNGILDGKFLLTGFKMLNPVDRFYGDYANLYNNVHDEAFTKRSRKFRNWYEYTQNLPGAFYLQIVKDLFKENLLIKGQAKILGQYVDLKRITQPLYLIAGKKDDITPQEQLFGIERYVSSKKITKLSVPAGHIGLFMGTKIIEKYWPGILKAVRTVVCHPVPA